MGLHDVPAKLTQARTRAAFVLAALIAVVCAGVVTAQRMGYPPEEFAGRRERLDRTIHAPFLVGTGAISTGD